MSLHLVDLELHFDQLPPPAIDEFLRDAQALVDDQRAEASPRFEPSNYLDVYGALAWLQQQNLASQPTFCEWGSGFGVVTCLASLLGFRATGIECEPELVGHARNLAARHSITTRFICGDYAQAPHAAIVFAYPWPDEEQQLADQLLLRAQPGDLLLTWLGVAHMRLQQAQPA